MIVVAASGGLADMDPVGCAVATFRIAGAFLSTRAHDTHLDMMYFEYGRDTLGIPNTS